jgi:predicted AAA+ superfamily ATPase
MGFIRRYIRNSVIEPIILKDIPKEFGEVDVLLLEKLITIFLSDPGQYLSLDEIAKELRRAKTTLYKALFYLEFSLLVRRVLNYRPSIRAASRKMSRIYAYHPCLTLPFCAPEEKYVENLVLFELDARHYWRDKDKEVDFLSDLTPVEVKCGSKVGKDDVKHLSYFMKKYAKLGVENGYVITGDAEGDIGGIRLIPLWKFCLMGLPAGVRS